MITTAEIRAHYAEELQEAVTVRRYSGSGTGRTYVDVEVRGRAWGYNARELNAAIQQGDTRVLLLVEDLTSASPPFALPLTPSDKLLVAGREIAIVSPSQRKALDGTPVVYDIQARG